MEKLEKPATPAAAAAAPISPAYRRPGTPGMALGPKTAHGPGTQKVVT
jgi:hypothetical protein